MSIQTRNRLAMITRRCIALLAVVATTAFLTNAMVSHAGDEPGQKHEHDQADMQKMMAEMMKLGQPGPNHEALKMFAGEWNATSKWYMPGQPPSVSSAESKAEMVLGGRYVHHNYEGQFEMPGPDGKMQKMDFHGVGMMGYDNYQKKYVSIWTDNMSTMMFMETGDYDAAKHEFTMHSSYPDPMKGGQMTKSKSVIRFHSPDKYTLEMHKEMAPGQWHKEMEIEYVRD